MSHASIYRRHPVLALLVGLALAACGGGDPAESPPPDGAAASASTLLDDDGLPMPSDPSAVPAGARLFGSPRYATRAQAAALQSALGVGARRVAVDCCGAAGVDAAVVAALDPAPTVALAVLVEGGDRILVLAAADRLQASGLERVWIVHP
jgi:hypothetical protein